MADNTIINNLKVLNNPVNSAKIIKASDLNEAFRSTSLITANLLDILGGGSSNEYIPNSEYPMPPGNIIDNTTTSGIIKNIMSQWLDNYTYKHAHRKDSTPTDKASEYYTYCIDFNKYKDTIKNGELVSISKIGYDMYGHYKNTEYLDNDEDKIYLGNLAIDNINYTTSGDHNTTTQFVVTNVKDDKRGINGSAYPIISTLDDIIYNGTGIYRVKNGINGIPGILFIKNDIVENSNTFGINNINKNEITDSGDYIYAIRVFIEDYPPAFSYKDYITDKGYNSPIYISRYDSSVDKWSDWENTNRKLRNQIDKEISKNRDDISIIENKLLRIKNKQECTVDMILNYNRDGAVGPFPSILDGKEFDIHLCIRYIKEIDPTDEVYFYDHQFPQVPSEYFTWVDGKSKFLDWLDRTLLNTDRSTVGVTGELYNQDYYSNGSECRITSITKEVSEDGSKKFRFNIIKNTTSGISRTSFYYEDVFNNNHFINGQCVMFSSVRNIYNDRDER